MRKQTPFIFKKFFNLWEIISFKNIKRLEANKKLPQLLNLDLTIFAAYANFPADLLEFKNAKKKIFFIVNVINKSLNGGIII
jgi:hypothetical protein